MDDSKEQRQFAKDLIDAGYKKYGSEDENQILRKNDKNLYQMIKNGCIKIILLEKHLCYILARKTKGILVQILPLH